MRRAVGFYSRGRGSDRRVHPVTGRRLYSPGVPFPEALRQHKLRSLHAQIVDESLIAREKFAREKGDFSRWSRRKNRSDVEDIDVKASPDVLRVIKRKPPEKLEEPQKATASEKREHPIVLRGAPALVARWQPVIDEKFSDLKEKPFTQREIFIREKRGPFSGYFRSQFSPFIGKWRPDEIAINPDASDKALTAIHETIHFRRFAQKDALLRTFWDDSDKEEKETTHETGARAGAISVQQTPHKSYYLYVRNVPFPQSWLDDLATLELLTPHGEMDTDRIERNIQRLQSLTNLHKISLPASKISRRPGERIPPEMVDVYMVTDEGERYHFFNPSVQHKPTSRKLALWVDARDKKIGEEKVYEYRDGKLFRVR